MNQLQKGQYFQFINSIEAIEEKHPLCGSVKIVAPAEYFRLLCRSSLLGNVFTIPAGTVLQVLNAKETIVGWYVTAHDKAHDLCVCFHQKVGLASEKLDGMFYLEVVIKE